MQNSNALFFKYCFLMKKYTLSGDNNLIVIMSYENAQCSILLLIHCGQHCMCILTKWWFCNRTGEENTFFQNYLKGLMLSKFEKLMTVMLLWCFWVLQVVACFTQEFSEASSLAIKKTVTFVSMEREDSCWNLGSCNSKVMILKFWWRIHDECCGFSLECPLATHSVLKPLFYYNVDRATKWQLCYMDCFYIEESIVIYVCG